MEAISSIYPWGGAVALRRPFCGTLDAAPRLPVVSPHRCMPPCRIYRCAGGHAARPTRCVVRGGCAASLASSPHKQHGPVTRVLPTIWLCLTHFSALSCNLITNATAAGLRKRLQPCLTRPAARRGASAARHAPAATRARVVTWSARCTCRRPSPTSYPMYDVSCVPYLTLRCRFCPSALGPVVYPSKLGFEAGGSALGDALDKDKMSLLKRRHGGAYEPSVSPFAANSCQLTEFGRSTRNQGLTALNQPRRSVRRSPARR